MAIMGIRSKDDNAGTQINNGSTYPRSGVGSQKEEETEPQQEEQPEEEEKEAKEEPLPQGAEPVNLQAEEKRH